MGGTEGVRRGSPYAFWNAASIAAGATSTAVQVGRKTNMFAFYVNSSATSTFQLQTAHEGAFTSQGTYPDADDQALVLVWHDLWYLGTSGLGNSTSCLIGGTGAFTIASIVPDFEVDWVRLKRTDAGGSNVTVTAGYSAWGD